MCLYIYYCKFYPRCFIAPHPNSTHYNTLTFCSNNEDAKQQSYNCRGTQCWNIESIHTLIGDWLDRSQNQVANLFISFFLWMQTTIEPSDTTQPPPTSLYGLHARKSETVATGMEKGPKQWLPHMCPGFLDFLTSCLLNFLKSCL